MTAATPPPVLVTTETGILRIQLRRPDKKNAITAAMYLTMIDAIRQAEQDPGLFNAFEIRHLTHFLRLRCLMSLLRNCLAAIPDPRRTQGKMYDLPHLLLFSILAVASGATSYRRVHQFIATHWQRLNLAFGCRWKRAPAYTSIRYALQGLEATAVERAFRTHPCQGVGR